MPSNLQVSIASRGDSGAWEAYVDARGDAAGYHSWRWREVFARAFGHESIYLIAREGGVIRGVLPLVQIKSLIFGRTLTSLPFVNYGGVMADSPEIGRALVDAAHDEARERRCSHVELRHIDAQFPGLPCKRHKVSMRLPLGPAMWDGLDRKVRNQIRKAEKSGLVVERGGEELIGDFYSVFARNMRDLGTPVYSRRLFDMGRSTPNEGTFKFKAQWGAEPVPLNWEYRLLTPGELPNVSPANPKYQFAIALWQKLPLAVTMRVGPMIVRAIP
jgi:serine/alanine adding enzyme